jgi:hypothetical protein
MATEPAAITLRYLQTLTEIAVEKNSTIVFPLPMDILTPLGRLLRRASGEAAAAPVVPEAVSPTSPSPVAVEAAP